MELRDYLELGAKKAGGLTALGKMLDLSQPFMSNAKAHRKPLPIDAVVKLAELINADLKSVIAANELVTEKKEEKRAYWRPFVEHARAAIVALILTIASVTSFLTPTPTQAAPMLESKAGTLCIMSTTRRKRRSKQRHLNGLVEMLFEALESMFKAWIPKPEPI